MNTSLISIIIPTYNRAHLIVDTLDSVLAQTNTNWECIVVDDGSTDNTDKVVKTYLTKDKRIRYYHRPKEKKKGPSACRNYGTSIAKGKYLIFLDSDDVLAKSCLENRVIEIQKDDNLDFVVFSMGHFQKINNLYIDKNRKVVLNPTKNLAIKHFLLYKFLWNTTRPIYSKKFIDSVGGFDEDLTVFTDPSLALKVLLKTNPNYKVIDKTDCYYRVDDSYKARYNDKKVKENLINNYHVYINKVLDMMTISEKKRFSNELKFSYQKFIIDYGSVIKNKKNNDIYNLMSRNIRFTLREKVYLFFLLKSVRNKNIKGSFFVYNHIKKYFNNLTKWYNH